MQEICRVTFNFDFLDEMYELLQKKWLIFMSSLVLYMHCRWTYSDFYKRYKVLAVSKDVQKNNIRRTCENIISKLVTVSGIFHFINQIS